MNSKMPTNTYLKNILIAASAAVILFPLASISETHVSPTKAAAAALKVRPDERKLPFESVDKFKEITNSNLLSSMDAISELTKGAVLFHQSAKDLEPLVKQVMSENLEANSEVKMGLINTALSMEAPDETSERLKLVIAEFRATNAKVSPAGPRVALELLKIAHVLKIPGTTLAGGQKMSGLERVIAVYRKLGKFYPKNNPLINAKMAQIFFLVPSKEVRQTEDQRLTQLGSRFEALKNSTGLSNAQLDRHEEDDLEILKISLVKNIPTTRLNSEWNHLKETVGNGMGYSDRTFTNLLDAEYFGHQTHNDVLEHFNQINKLGEMEPVSSLLVKISALSDGVNHEELLLDER